MRVMESTEITTNAHPTSARRSHVSLRNVVESQQFTVPLLMELFDGVPLEQTSYGRRGINSERVVYFADVGYVGNARRFDMGELVAGVLAGADVAGAGSS